MKLRKVIGLMLLLTASLPGLSSCSITGPQGPQGEQGVQGQPGKDGENGQTPHIGADGDWWIGNIDTNIPATGDTGATGPQGEQGIQGEPGKDGHTPVITIGENGNWFIDGVDTGAKAQGDKGESGEEGSQGENGKDGSSLLTGNGIPANDLGKIDDSYIDLESWNYYVKTSDGWVLQGNIKGEDGKDVSSDHNGTEGLEFYPINDTECAVAVGRAKLLKEIVIPSTYKNHAVTSIYGVTSELDCGGFASCLNLEKITIPNSVTNIGAHAFDYCTSLTSIVIPDSVTIIDSYAFESCTSLTDVTIGNSVTTIGESAFYGCSSLTSVTIPDSVTIIDSYAFESCTSLTSIVIPDSVTTIGNYSFLRCSSLTIYCEASSQPSGWDYSWNYSDIPVYWAGEWEYDADGNPTPII